MGGVKKIIIIIRERSNMSHYLMPWKEREGEKRGAKKLKGERQQSKRKI